MNGNWSQPPGKVIAQRWCPCKCGKQIRVQTIKTNVKGARPVEVLWCPSCDGVH